MEHRTAWRILRNKDRRHTLRGRITINGQVFTEYMTIGESMLRFYNPMARAVMRVRLQAKLDAHYGAGVHSVYKVFKNLEAYDGRINHRKTAAGAAIAERQPAA